MDVARSSARGAEGRSRPATGSPAENHREESAELAEVRAQLRELQQTIEAIRTGGVDSLIVGPPGQEQVYALATADRSYRLIVEAMNEGAATVSTRGVILDANPRLGSMTGRNVSELIGTPVLDLIPAAHRPAFARLLDVGAGDSTRGEVDLTGSGGTTIPVLLAVSGFDLDGMLLRCLVLTDLTAQHAAESSGGQCAPGAARAELLPRAGAGVRGARLVGSGSGPRAHDHLVAAGPSDLRAGPRAIRREGGDPRQSCPPGRPADGLRSDHGRPGGRHPRYQAEYRIIRPDGSLRWLLQAAVVERDDAGAPGRMLGICQDITDRKRIEDEIRASAAYNRSLIDASLNPMFTIGQDGAISDVNAATERATGYGRAELLGTGFRDYFTEPDLAQAGYELAFAEGSAGDSPLRLRHRDGHLVPVLLNAAVYRDQAGHVLGVLATARDITETERLQAALRASEERLRVLFDNAPIGIGELALSGDLVRINRSFCQFIGYTADEVLSMRLIDGPPASRRCRGPSRHQATPPAGEIDTLCGGRDASCKRGVPSSGARCSGA